MPAIASTSFPLSDGAVLVRPFVTADAETIVRASHDPDVLRWTTTAEGLSTAAAQRWIERANRAIDNGHEVRLAVVDAATCRPAGQVGLALEPHAIGRVFYWTGADARGRGLATRAVRLLSRWAFAELDMARLEISVDPRNEPSLAVARNAGYVREGLLRSAFVFKGERLDTVVFSRLPSDP